MNFDLQPWLNELTAKLDDVFGKRMIFIGYQGSYRVATRGSFSVN